MRPHQFFVHKVHKSVHSPAVCGGKARFGEPDVVCFLSSQSSVLPSNFGQPGDEAHINPC